MTMKSSPHSPQLENAYVQQQRSSAAKNNKKETLANVTSLEKAVQADTHTPQD